MQLGEPFSESNEEWNPGVCGAKRRIAASMCRSYRLRTGEETINPAPAAQSASETIRHCPFSQVLLTKYAQLNYYYCRITADVGEWRAGEDFDARCLHQGWFQHAQARSNQPWTLKPFGIVVTNEDGGLLARPPDTRFNARSSAWLWWLSLLTPSRNLTRKLPSICAIWVIFLQYPKKSFIKYFWSFAALQQV